MAALGMLIGTREGPVVAGSCLSVLDGPDFRLKTAPDPKSPVATDGYRASLGKHITGKSQMRWIRVVASLLHPNSKQGDGRCRCFLR
jgi:hypothetical protein